ncbi:unnamed protein product [Phaeothamnion confervicola]
MVNRPRIMLSRVIFCILNVSQFALVFRLASHLFSMPMLMDSNPPSRFCLTSFMLSICPDKTPMLRRADTGDWVGTFEGHKGAVHGVCMDDDALLAATASADFSARMWDAVTGDQVHEFVHKHVVKSVEFSRDRSLLATGGHEGVLRAYSVEAPDKPPVLELKVVDGPDRGVGKVIISKVRWAKDPNLLLVGSSDGNVRAWDLRTGGSAGPAIEAAGVAGGVVDLEVSRTTDVVSVAAGGHAYFFDAGGSIFSFAFLFLFCF